jgi:hypothetical protein
MESISPALEAGLPVSEACSPALEGRSQVLEARLPVSEACTQTLEASLLWLEAPKHGQEWRWSQ